MCKKASITLFGWMVTGQSLILSSMPVTAQGRFTPPGTYTPQICQNRERSLAEEKQKRRQERLVTGVLKSPIWTIPSFGLSTLPAQNAEESSDELVQEYQRRVDDCWAAVKKQQQQQQPMQDQHYDADLRSNPSGSGYGSGF